MVCLGQKAKIRLLEKQHKVFPKLLGTLTESFPHPDPCNAPAIKSQLRSWGVGEQDHGSCVWSQGCPEGPRLALMCCIPGGCCGTWRSFPCRGGARRPHRRLPWKGESHWASQFAMKGSCLALLGDGPGQSITSTMSWATSVLQCRGSGQLRGFWPCDGFKL